MLGLFPLSYQLLVVLLGFGLTFSLIYIKHVGYLAEQEESLFQERVKYFFNENSTHNLTPTDSPTHKPSHLCWGTDSKEEYLTKGDAFQRCLRNSLSHDLDALKDAAPFLPIGVGVERVEGKFQVKFSGYQINYDHLTSGLSYIHEQFKSFPLGGISISNLPINETNGSIIHEIIREHLELKKLSISSCYFENENEFYEGLPSLPLTELELSECDRIEEVLKKTNGSLEVLQLTNNQMNLDFRQLTRILEYFPKLKKLTLERNEITSGGFEVFFYAVFNLEKLKELNLVNDDIVDEFLRLLSEKEVSSQLEILSLMNQNRYSSYPNLDSLLKLKLKTLRLSLDYEYTFENRLSTYLLGQDTLQKIVHLNYGEDYSISANIIDSMAKKNIIFDLRKRNECFFNNLSNSRQLLYITKLCVSEKMNTKSLNSILRSVSSLPILLDLVWENEEIDLIAITNKTPNLESLTVRREPFENLVRKGFFTKEIIFPKLKEFIGYYPNYPEYEYEEYCKDGNFYEFLISNPTIKILKLEHNFLERYVKYAFKPTDSLRVENIEEMTIRYDNRSHCNTLFYFLQFFPNIKKLKLIFNGYKLKDYDTYDLLDQAGPTKIEELSIHNSSKESMFDEGIEWLLVRIPNIKVLSFERVPAEIVNVITKSLKYCPQLRKLEMRCCQFEFYADDYVEKEEDTLICRFTKELKSLKYLE